MYLIHRCGCFACKVANTNAMTRYRNGGTNREAPALHPAGTARRLRALAAVGHSLEAIAAELGLHSEAVGQLRRGHRTVRPETAARIAAVYELMWDRPPSGPRVGQVVRNAQRFGWAPPMAWDDETINNPAARPAVANRGALDLKPCGTAAAARRHHRHGEALDFACINAERRQRAERRTA